MSEVVRCVECRHYRPNADTSCTRLALDIYDPERFFCALGELRDVRRPERGRVTSREGEEGRG